MPNLTQLRIAAREIFDTALQAVDSGDAVRKALHCQGSDLIIRGEALGIGNQKIYSVACGKAAPAMAAALEQQLGNHFSRGLLSGPASARAELSSRWQRHEGGHPLPNESSLLAANAAFELLDHANNENALLIFLISGGGSAMLESPANDDVSLADLRIANKVLVKCGASIGEINAVRRAFSAVKGGKLAARASECEQITLIVSDVPRGQEWNVASGPTLDPPADAPLAREVIERYRLQNQLPPSILKVIDSQTERGIVTSQLRQHFVLLDNQTALEAAAQAARERGFVTEIADDISDQPIEEGCALLLDRLDRMRNVHGGSGKIVCLISGGEFSCPVRGDGIGGRNLETALRLAIDRRLPQFNAAAICAGSDGIDGNSSSAGAIIDSTTFNRAQAIGLEPHDFLERSDSYSFFTTLGDVLSTGRTGTNVRDVRIVVAET